MATTLSLSNHLKKLRGYNIWNFEKIKKNFKSNRKEIKESCVNSLEICRKSSFVSYLKKYNFVIS